MIGRVRTLLGMTLLGGMLLVSAPSSADAERGRLLYENQCTVCHESVVHIRERRKAANAAELRAFIQRWAAELKLTWSQDEMNDVFQYLNKRYYKFPQ